MNASVDKSYEKGDKVKKRLHGIFIPAVITLLLLEVVCRGLVYWSTPEGLRFDKELMYTGEPNSPLFREVMNDIGCIGPNWQEEKKAGEKRVLLLGGSTSFSKGYPAYLQASLTNLHPGMDFTVVSCGKPRYTSYINKVNFEDNLLQYNPDIVVLYMGINDAIYNSFPWLNAKPEVGYFNWKSLSRWISYDLFKYHLVDKVLRSQPEFSDGEIRSKAIIMENVREIIEIAQSNSVEVVLSDFALGYPTGDTALKSKIMQMEPTMKHFWGSVASTKYAVKMHNSVMEQLAAEYRLPVARVAASIPQNSEYFVDICHMTDKGKRLLAKEISKVIPLND
ncbi:MAG: hypothetical protein HWE07_15655 [Cytophagia bacterium]|nr:hypothetical protein [Cytophagia bacterium]